MNGIVITILIFLTLVTGFYRNRTLYEVMMDDNRFNKVRQHHQKMFLSNDYITYLPDKTPVCIKYIELFIS